MKTTTDQLPVIRQETERLSHQITNLVVVDDETLAEASDRIRLVKDLHRKVKAEKEIFAAPAKEIISAAKAKYDPLLETLEGFEKVLKETSQAFLVKRHKAEQEAQAKIAARVERGTLKVETAIKKLDELPQDQHKVRTDKSMLRLQFKKDIEITNTDDIPTKYWMIDMVQLRKDVLGGTQVTGVKIIEVPVTHSI